MATHRSIKDIARSLIALAMENGTVPQALRDLRAVDAAFRADPSLAVDLDETCVTLEDRQRALKKALERQVDPLVLNALLALQRRGILDEVGDLRTAAATEAERTADHREAAVASATDLTDADERKIARDLQKRFGGTIDVTTSVDPSLIGGLLVRVGDQVIDATVKGRLTRLSHTLYV